MSFVAGWDGGGSKTAVLCLDEQEGGLLRTQVGPLNPNGTDEADIRASIRSALLEMERLPGGLEACRALVIGAAGISNPHVKDLLESLVRQEGYAGRLLIAGDHEILLEGAVGKAGAVLIAGTGSICIGRNAAGGSRRAGGLGYLIGDEGSGYWIGLAILRAAAKALDGRGQPTLLTKTVLDALYCRTLHELTARVYGGSLAKAEIAALAKLLSPALRQKDAVALEIAQAAAEELYQLAKAVLVPLGLERERLALAGGLISFTSPLRALLEAKLKEHYLDLTLTEPEKDAAQGAAMMALNL